MREEGTKLPSSPSQGPWETHGETGWVNQCVSVKGESKYRWPWTVETGSHEKEQDADTNSDQNEENRLPFFPGHDKGEVKYPRSCGQVRTSSKSVK